MSRRVPPPAACGPGLDARGPPGAPRRASGAADLEVPEFQPGRAADVDPEPEPRGLPGPLGRPRAAVPSGSLAHAPAGRPDPARSDLPVVPRCAACGPAGRRPRSWPPAPWYELPLPVEPGLAGRACPAVPRPRSGPAERSGLPEPVRPEPVRPSRLRLSVAGLADGRAAHGRSPVTAPSSRRAAPSEPKPRPRSPPAVPVPRGTAARAPPDDGPAPVVVAPHRSPTRGCACRAAALFGGELRCPATRGGALRGAPVRDAPVRDAPVRDAPVRDGPHLASLAGSRLSRSGSSLRPALLSASPRPEPGPRAGVPGRRACRRAGEPPVREPPDDPDDLPGRTGPPFPVS
jgi:hypothetical protein